MEHPVRRLIWLLIPLLLGAEGISKQSVAYKIYRNECAANPKYLIHWNSGEAFPSLGIGHFIWYPKGTEAPFDESFPKLIAFISARGHAMPRWLEGAAPWHDAKAMRQDPRLPKFRAFLEKTMDLQAAFMQARAEDALPAMLEGLDASQKHRLLTNYRRLAATPQGTYILIDYRNFKGDGTSATERYKGEGWGLRQVLLCMPEERPPQQAFVTCARKLLQKRVQNAPPSRHEERWLRGWFNRLNTYLKSH